MLIANAWSKIKLILRRISEHLTPYVDRVYQGPLGGTGGVRWCHHLTPPFLNNTYLFVYQLYLTFSWQFTVNWISLSVVMKKLNWHILLNIDVFIYLLKKMNFFLLRNSFNIFSCILQKITTSNVYFWILLFKKES